jgi:hypothetical protein
MDIAVRKYYLQPEEVKEYNSEFFITFESGGKILEIYDQTVYDVSEIEFPEYFFLARESIYLNWVTLENEEMYDIYVHEWIIKNDYKHKVERKQNYV